MFTLLLAFTALLVAGCAAYFSVLGIATLFSGHFWSVVIMAGSLEIGKIVGTSFLYRYWDKTAWFLRTYLLIAIFTLVCITSMGIFGYLSSGYQVNRGKTELIDSKVALVVQQKESIQNEIEQNNLRIQTLNDARRTQEQRLPSMSRLAARPVYEDMERAAEEIKNLTARNQDLQSKVFERDEEMAGFQNEMYELHDIGTFKFVAEAFGVELDTVVKFFILVIVLVFDPLAVALILGYNIAVYGRIQRKEKVKHIKEDLEDRELLIDEPIPVTPKTKTTITEEITEEVIPETTGKTRKYSAHPAN
jgi:hypothetical protein